MKYGIVCRRALLFVAALTLGACGDDEPVGTELDYQPLETARQVDEVVGVLAESRNAFAGLAAAGDALGNYTSTEAAQELLRFRPGLDPRAHDHDGAREREVWEQRLTFPAAIQGRTLAWSTGQNRYVVDENAGGGPENGVRIIYYAMNAFINQPAQPLQELGFIDLVDMDVEGQERMRIRVVDESRSAPITVLDYVVGYTGSQAEADGNINFTAEGDLSNGTTIVPFDLAQVYTWNEAEDYRRLSIDYGYGEAGQLRFGMEATSSFDSPGWEDLNILVQITSETEAVVIDVALDAGGSLEGDIAVNGSTVVLIAGEDGRPTFRHADGGPLRSDDRRGLEDLWTLVVGLLSLSEGLMQPAGILLLPG